MTSSNLLLTDQFLKPTNSQQSQRTPPIILRKLKFYFLIFIMVPFSVFLFGLFFVLGRPTTSDSSAIEGRTTESIMVYPNNTNPLTSHVLDQNTGRPGADIKVVLYRRNGETWAQVAEKITNEDGRVGHMLPGEEFTPGVYKLYFHTKAYYEARGEKTFYPFIEIVFEVESPGEHYHVPVLLSAYGYATYRGS